MTTRMWLSNWAMLPRVLLSLATLIVLMLQYHGRILPRPSWNLVCPQLIHQSSNSFGICTEHGSDTAVLCAKFQNDWTTETDVMDEQNFARFEFKMSFGALPWITRPLTAPSHFLNRCWVFKRSSDIHARAISQETLHWRHNESDGVSNYQHHDCLLNDLFSRRSKKTSKLRITGLCVGNSPVTGEFRTKGPVTRKMFPFDDVVMYINPQSLKLTWKLFI